MGRRLTIAIAALAVAGLVLAAGAGARTALKYQYKESFDGSTSSAGKFTGVAHVSVDQQTGQVYVTDQGKTAISRFDASGNAVKFSNPPVPDTSSITVQDFARNTGTRKGSYIVVDNSGGPTQGRFYVLTHTNSGILEEPEILAFKPTGEELGGNFPLCGARCSKPEQFDTEPRGFGVDVDGNLWISTPSSGFLTPVPGEIVKLSPDGVQMPGAILGVNFGPRTLDLDADGNVYIAMPPANSSDDVVRKFVPDTSIPLGAEYHERLFSRATAAFPASNSDGNVTVDRSRALVYVNGGTRVDVYDDEGRQVGEIGLPEGPYTGLGTQSTGVAVNETSGHVYVTNTSTQKVDVFESLPAVTVPDVTTEATSGVTGSQATLNGTIDPDGGGDTTVCKFEWGPNGQIANSAPCTQGDVHPSAGGAQQVSAQITGLLKGRQYYYRFAGGNAAGPLQRGKIHTFQAAEKPVVSDVDVTDVNITTADISSMIKPEGGNTSYWIEIGETTSYGMVFPAPFKDFYEEYKECYFRWFAYKIPACTGRLRWATGSFQTVEEATQLAKAHVSGLKPDTTYHYRVVAKNDAGTVPSADQTFHTFDFIPTLIDTCPNKLARQQTSGAHLLDCRGYEIVSAGDAGGYDVRSDLAPGQEPLPGFPDADGRALYAVLDGGIPGTGNPTNRGPDPYVAVRDEADERWETTYVGVPSFAPSATPFASRLADADGGLGTFAFGGSDFCSPCFDDGDTNVPIRLPDGTLTKGMAGSLDPGDSEPAGDVRRHFSADGIHFVFGTTAKFEPTGNGNGTDVTIYDRNLLTGVTQVVSTLPNGNTIAAGDDLAVLGISADGSRIVVGEILSTDPSGNDYVHPYMHVGSTKASIDLAPGTTSGVIYNGMTDDGSTVFLSSPDKLTGEDSDESTDIFAAEPDGATADLTRVSVGTGAGNTDACDPQPNSVNASWNSADGPADCDALPVGGGGSIAGDAGSIWFLSPEQLDGSSGTADAPNLYFAAPGEAPRFVATLESKLSGPSPLTTVHPFLSNIGSFSNPRSVASHAESGSVYVLENGTGSIRKYDASGSASDFIATGNNSLGGLTLTVGLSQVAVDNSGGAADGNIYVTSGATLRVYDETGALISTLTGATATGGYGGLVTAVATAPNGDVYVGAASGRVHRYVPAAGTLVDANYVSSLVLAAGNWPAGIAADSAGAVYTHLSVSGIFQPDGVTKYDATQFGVPTSSGAVFDAGSKAVGVDPATDHVYVSHGDEVVERLPSGSEHGELEPGIVANVQGIGINPQSGRIYAADPNESRVSVFDTLLGADPRVDSPVVVNAVNDAETRHTSDFAVNDDGSIAAFPSTIELTGYPTKRTTQVYRFDTGDDSLVCISCAVTNRPSVGDSSLASNGSSVSDDGRLFFNSVDRLVLGDGNGQRDVYEWSEVVDADGVVQLISTGVSEAPSSLLSVSDDGTDAFFFTRQKLVPQDLNGPTIKLYTAREEGGFFKLPPEQPCRASDECRGAGSTPAVPAAIGSVTGTSGQVQKPKRCRKGFVKKRGKCVKKPKKRKANKRRRAGR